MDVRIRERLVGALVLVALIVLLVPALLKGPGSASDQSPAAVIKSVEITLDGAAGPAENDVLVPEPEIVRSKPEIPAAVTPKSIEPARPAGEPAKPAAAQQTAWAVQLGAFSSRSKADGLVAKLRSRGYSAFVFEYPAGGQLLHRVRVGPEQDRARAVAIAERLRNDGFQPVVAPHP
jgi:DedD protein